MKKDKDVSLTKKNISKPPLSSHLLHAQQVIAFHLDNAGWTSTEESFLAFSLSLTLSTTPSEIHEKAHRLGIIRDHLESRFGAGGVASVAHSLQGPVVHSIVSLTSSLRDQLVKCFTTL